ncbi:hypothetical protein ACPWR0_01170 [Pandoraea pneumonica]|uniref:hypothetical protein n=2 Tax=Pandoraea pneumonica TaxID=2508299 RepID=UPI003CEA9FB5
MNPTTSQIPHSASLTQLDSIEISVPTPPQVGTQPRLLRLPDDIGRSVVMQLQEGAAPAGAAPSSQRLACLHEIAKSLLNTAARSAILVLPMTAFAHVGDETTDTHDASRETVDFGISLTLAMSGVGNTLAKAIHLFGDSPERIQEARALTWPGAVMRCLDATPDVQAGANRLENSLVAWVSLTVAAEGILHASQKETGDINAHVMGLVGVLMGAGSTLYDDTVDAVSGAASKIKAAANCLRSVVCQAADGAGQAVKAFKATADGPRTATENVFNLV